MPFFGFALFSLSELFPCGKLTQGRWKRSVTLAPHTSEDSPETVVLEEYDSGDLTPTENPFHLLNFTNTERSPAEDENSLTRIVGGRDCKEGECPWQVTAEHT